MNFTCNQKDILTKLNVKVIHYDLEHYHHKNDQCLLEPALPPANDENTACLVYLMEDEEKAAELAIKACEKLRSLCEDQCFLHIVKTQKNLIGVLAAPELFRPVNLGTN